LKRGGLGWCLVWAYADAKRARETRQRIRRVRIMRVCV
jgi:hypothetical protein